MSEKLRQYLEQASPELREAVEDALAKGVPAEDIEAQLARLFRREAGVS